MVASETVSTRFWLCHFFDNDPSDACPAALRDVRNANWWPILRQPLFAASLRQALANDKQPAAAADDDELLVLAIACLQAFVLDNFLGPPLDDAAYADLPHYVQLLDSVADVRQLLEVDGEELNVNVTRPELLLVAKAALERLLLAETETVSTRPARQPGLDFVVRWWYLRSLYVHQQLLGELTDTLYTALRRHSAALLDAPPPAAIDRDALTLLRLEVVQAQLAYRRAWQAQEHLDAARAQQDVELQVQGFLGRRTKWQQKALPQLALRVSYDAADGVHRERAPAARTHAESVLPCLLRLDDEVRLERVTFESEEDNRTLELPAVVQQLVLGVLQYSIRSQPKDLLADEELQPYLTTLLYQTHGPWAARITTLLQNITLESTHKRTIERSLKQCEEVAHLLGSAGPAGAESAASAAQRLSLAHSSYMRPRWHVQSQLAALMCSLGMLKTALDTFLRLRQWPDVIACYTALDLRSKAAEIIEQQLAKAPTVELLCLLGDARDDVAYYERAWEHSQRRSGRAQRHWGGWLFARKDYAAAIPHLQLSLALNSLQEVTWARLGYAALALERWELAAEAYRRYTNLEPHGFECWNNLSKAYINMGDKGRAHKVLQEALKCNFGNWKVWENYLLVSVDTGHFEDALNAYDRLIELKGKYLDAQVLEIVCGAVAADVPEADGRGSGRLRKKALTLVGHLGVLLPGEAAVWEMTALLRADEPLLRAQALQKAFRCGTQTRTEAQWSKDPKTVAAVLELCGRLCAASVEAWQVRTDAVQAACASQLASARLSVQGAVRAAKEERYGEFGEEVAGLEGRLEEIKEILLKR